MIERTAVVQKCRPQDKDPNKPANEQVWCVLTKNKDRVLGRHPSKEKADAQLSAIEISKRGESQSSIDSVVDQLIDCSFKD